METQRRADERLKEESARVREKQKEEQNAQLAESFRHTLNRKLLENSLRIKLGDTGVLGSRSFVCLAHSALAGLRSLDYVQVSH